ncbi:MAG: Dabb family protein [Acidobacteriota bacterium]
MISHIVLFEPKASMSLPDKRLFAQSVLSVCSRIEFVQRLSIGRRTNVDVGYERSFGDKTYEYSAVLEFETRERLIQYLTNPLHAELGRLFWENCERTVICETESVDPSSPHAVDLLVL